MLVEMNDLRLSHLSEINDFLKSSQQVELKLSGISDKYELIREAVSRFKYRKLKRSDRRIVLNYLRKLTRYKKAQLFRLVDRATRGDLKTTPYVRTNPNFKYDGVDVKLLEQTDELHKRLSSVATKEILRREYEVFGHDNFQSLAGISSSHINNLRKRLAYKATWVNGTKAREVPIGLTKPPENNNRPGSLRVDTVHQNGVYHLNAVDVITQWEVVVCVPQLSEIYLQEALYDLLLGFPFEIKGFHSDRGGEFVNYMVAGMLNKLLIEQTKSRSRHCNDNALVESKNGSVVRKNMGYWYISSALSEEVNLYFKNFLNPYLNYHRPCLFVTEILVDSKGRKRKIYGEATMPYEKLKEVSEVLGENFLRDEITFESLDKIAYEKSDNEFAKILRAEEDKLFNLILSRKEAVV